MAAGLIPRTPPWRTWGPGRAFRLVLAILRPDLAVTPDRGQGKKVTFLEAVIERLGLVGVRALHLRGRRRRQPAFRENFSVVTARAVAALPTLLEVTLPLVQVGGRLVALKDPSVEEEVAAARKATALLGAAAGRVIPARCQEATGPTAWRSTKSGKNPPPLIPPGRGKPQNSP